MTDSRKNKTKAPGSPVRDQGAVASKNSGSAGAKPPRKSASRASGKKTPVKTESRVTDIAGKSVQFLREVRVELLKVNWPSRKETLASTTIILILVVIVSIYLSAVDFGVRRLINFILG